MRVRVCSTGAAVQVPGAAAFSGPDVSQRPPQASVVPRWESQPGMFFTGLWTHPGEVVVPGPALLGAQRRVLVEPGEDGFLVKVTVFLAR